MRLDSRAGRHLTASFPEIVDALAEAIPGKSIALHGELVAAGASGAPDFAAPQRRLGARPTPSLQQQVPVSYVAFDPRLVGRPHGRPPMRHTTITLARPSIAESRPNPSNATELARTAATIATAPSAAMQPSDSQDNSRAYRAVRRQRASRWTARTGLPAPSRPPAHSCRAAAAGPTCWSPRGMTGLSHFLAGGHAVGGAERNGVARGGQHDLSGGQQIHQCRLSLRVARGRLSDDLPVTALQDVPEVRDPNHKIIQACRKCGGLLPSAA